MGGGAVVVLIGEPTRGISGMPTLYLGRLIVCAPLAGGKDASVASWINGNLSMGSVVAANLGPNLAAVGDATNTVIYRWCNLQLGLSDAKAVLSRLCTLAGVATPTVAQWDNATPAQKLTWWNSVRGTVFTNYGVWCQLARNDATWDDPEAVLTLRSWKRA